MGSRDVVGDCEKGMSNHDAVIARARSLTESGRLREAEALVRRSLQRSPHDPHLNNAMANVLLQAGDQRAVFFAEKAANARPTDARVVATYGTALVASGRAAEAREQFERAVGLEPPVLGAYLGLTNLLHAGDELERAVEVCGRGLEAFEWHPSLCATMTTVLLDAGRPDEAVAFGLESVERHPDDPLVAQAAAFVSNYSASLTGERKHELHVRYGACVRGLARARLLVTDFDPERVLRIGFVSPDFRRHPVASFAEPIIEGLDRERFRVICYSTTHAKDHVTERIAGHADEFVDAAAISDDALTDRIVRDRIDVLVDLAGHTLGHRLGVLARKPAPVQATAIGYPNTTGLEAVDARIVDWVTDPAGAERFAVESLVRLPGCFLCFRPPDDAPEPGPLPAITAGHVTFGSFNILPKVSDRIFELWARVLREIPTARFVMKNKQLADAGIMARVRARFEAAGLGTERVELLPPTASFAEHLALYDRLDLALDTFPYHGTTTTCEALWMGVPTITLMGDVHAARVGGSLLRAAGLEALVAEDEDGFVRIAREMAGSLGRLREMRAGMRERLRGSRLCDVGGYVRGLGEAYRALWQTCCAKDSG